MHRKLLVAAAIACLPSLASANQLLSLYDKAVENDAQLQAARYQRDAALETYPQARSALLPQLGASYSNTKGSYEGVSTTRYVDSSGAPNSLSTPYDADTSNTALSVSLSQTLFDWAAVQTLKQSSRQAALAQASFRQSEQDLVLRVATAYFEVLYAQDSLQFAKAQNAAVERQLEQAQKRFEVGLSAITDVQEAQASYDLTVADVIAAEQGLATAQESITEIVGAPFEPPTRLQDEIPLPAPTPASVDAWLDAALRDNLVLNIAQLQVEVAERGTRVARSQRLPTVSFGADYSDSQSESRSNQSENLDENQEQRGTSYGITVNLPIFNGGLTRSRVREADFVHDQRQAELDVQQRSVEKTVRNAFLSVLSGASRVRALKQAVVSNTTALDASETGLQVGTRTAVDVLNAQSQLYRAQTDYARARYDYLLAVLQLKAAGGRLGIDDLREIDGLLVGG